MDRGYRIRSAVAVDVERILALDREIDNLPHWRVADYLAALPIVGPIVSKGKEVDTVRRCFFVAEVNAVVAGFAVGKLSTPDAPAELESLGVAERARRSGLGKALCNAVIEWSTRMGAAELELEVRSQSAGPAALYQGLGFMPVGRRVKYYHDPVDDAVIMRLALCPCAK